MLLVHGSAKPFFCLRISRGGCMAPSSWITAVKRKSDQNANPVANPGSSRVRGSDRAGKSGLSKARSSFRWSKSRRVVGRFRQDPACPERSSTAPDGLPGPDADQCRHYRLPVKLVNTGASHDARVPDRKGRPCVSVDSAFAMFRTSTGWLTDIRSDDRSITISISSTNASPTFPPSRRFPRNGRR